MVTGIIKCNYISGGVHTPPSTGEAVRASINMGGRNVTPRGINCQRNSPMDCQTVTQQSLTLSGYLTTYHDHNYELHTY